jgi:hypothetical protein
MPEIKPRRPVEVIDDEAQVPVYELPDLLSGVDGRPVRSAQDWLDWRRAEVLNLFTAQMYGKVPISEITTRVELISYEPGALGGLATRKEITLHFSTPAYATQMHLLLYLPNQRPPAPVFLGLNFYGNHCIHPDPGISLSSAWMMDGEGFGCYNHHATQASRGCQQNRWQVERLLNRGYATATAYYGDLDPDFDDGFQNGVHPLFYASGQTLPAPDEMGSIVAGARPGCHPLDGMGSVAAWAWGLSRALDYLQSDPDVDVQRVIVHGHSRLGKTALWAGALDERFAAIISNNSGCGGAALSRRCFGETVRMVNEEFPHWFCTNFHAYNDRENELPFDQHMLIALMAPRPVYIASAAEDLWADPRGEFLAGLHASPVYRLFGEGGMAAEEMPALEQPVLSRIGYHIRGGGHDVTAYDWERFMDFTDRFVSYMR